MCLRQTNYADTAAFTFNFQNSQSFSQAPRDTSVCQILFHSRHFFLSYLVEKAQVLLTTFTIALFLWNVPLRTTCGFPALTFSLTRPNRHANVTAWFLGQKLFPLIFFISKGWCLQNHVGISRVSLSSLASLLYIFFFVIFKELMHLPLYLYRIFCVHVSRCHTGLVLHIDCGHAGMQAWRMETHGLSLRGFRS